MLNKVIDQFDDTIVHTRLNQKVISCFFTLNLMVFVDICDTFSPSH